jgi:hypothetical protein
VNNLFDGVKSHNPGRTIKSLARMRNIEAARREINRKAVGIDGIEFEAYVDPVGSARWNPDLLALSPQLELIRDVQDSIRYGCIPDATVGLTIKSRTIEVGTVANRLAERAIFRKLICDLDPHLSDKSFAYRPKRSPQQAILQVRDAVRRGLTWALKTDFKKFFDHVDRNILRLQLKDTFTDRLLCAGLMNAVSPVLLIEGQSLRRRNGLPQGNGLSPLLSNVYLNAFDEACSGLAYFRYSDDLLVLTRTREEAEEALRRIWSMALRLRLSLNHEKTIIRNLYRGSVVFPGFEIRGGNIYPSPNAVAKLRNALKFRGQEDRKRQILTAFVRRFAVGRVRKLCRRLDRDLHRKYPAGISLVGLLEEHRADRWQKGGLGTC